MSDKKEPSLAELLELAKRPILKEEKAELYQDTISDTQRFVIAFEIKDGKNKVPNSSLWEAYKTWAPNPVTNYKFFLDFNKYFKQERKNSYRYFNLNYKPWEIIWKATQIKKEREALKKK